MSKELSEFTPGEELFMKVSAARPASIIGQAALIALECTTQNLNPEKLIKNFSNKALTRMMSAANKAHTSLPVNRRHDIYFSDVQEVVATDFSYALSFMQHLDTQTIHEIANKLYYDHINNHPGLTRVDRSEEPYWQSVVGLIGKDKADRVLLDIGLNKLAFYLINSNL